MSSLVNNLARHPFLKGLTMPYLEIIDRYATEVQFRANTDIIHEGEITSSFYLILSGNVALKKFVPGRGESTMQILSDGELVGWSWLIPPYIAQLTATAVLPTVAIEIDGHGLYPQCEADPAFGYDLISRFGPLFGRRFRQKLRQMQPTQNGSPHIAR